MHALPAAFLPFFCRPYADSQFDLTSTCSTAKHLFGVPGFLTMRDAWAGSFHELLTLKTPRTDAPLHLPDGPPLFAERQARQARQLRAASEATRVGERGERHCSSAEAARRHGFGECAAEGTAVTTKQRNRIKWLASMTHVAPPPEAALARMTKEEAARWIHARWEDWVRHGLHSKSSSGRQGADDEQT